MTVFTDAIEERTPGAGVTIDGLTVKDGDVPGFVTDAELAAHESAYGHANIPTADQLAALGLYETALGLAEAGQVLTASGPGAAAFAAQAAAIGQLAFKVMQSGTADPSVQIVYTTGDLTVNTAVRNDVGLYTIAFAQTTPTSRLQLFIGSVRGYLPVVTGFLDIQSDNGFPFPQTWLALTIQTYDLAVGTERVDGMLDSTDFLIFIYP
ncbi:MAG: hypothetical protein KBE23_03230 [Chloroflexi bacterium]|nr:hypothetical protein [Chloroflexota bacterium]MBP7041726.1 hypothetical protein [Chloroflexota bacterium]